MTASSCADRDGGGPRPMVPWTPAVRVPPSGEGVPWVLYQRRCGGDAKITMWSTPRLCSDKTAPFAVWDVRLGAHARRWAPGRSATETLV